MLKRPKKVLRHANAFFRQISCAAIAIILFCPFNAVGREKAARQFVDEFFAMTYCLAEEGIWTYQDAGITLYALLAKQGIEYEKVRVLLKDRGLSHRATKIIEELGGCVSFAKKYDQFIKSN